MKTTAVRLYGAMDLRMDTFDLPEIGDDGVRVEVISDSICMSSYKATLQGTAHKRVPKDAAEHPVIIGHEFCGKIVEVGKHWQHKYRVASTPPFSPRISTKARCLRRAIPTSIAAGPQPSSTFPSKHWRWIACCPTAAIPSFTARWRSR